MEFTCKTAHCPLHGIAHFLSECKRAAERAADALEAERLALIPWHAASRGSLDVV